MKLFATPAPPESGTRPSRRPALHPIPSKNRAGRGSRLPLLVFVLAGTAITATLCSAQNRKETRLEIAPGGNLNVVNPAGSVTLHSAPGRQVLVTYITHSEKIELDQNSTANRQRVELRTHALPEQHPSAEEARVDLDITVPPGIAVSVNTVSAPVTAEGLSGDISLSSETGQITVRNVAKSHVHIRSMSAPVSLANVTGAHVEVQSSGGAVKMENVTGPRVVAGNSSGDIDYRGDCSGGGDYIMTTHSGAINLVLPPTASVDLVARSTKGSVENEFPLEEKHHQVFPPIQGRSFAGTSNSGSSSVELQSISGKIRVKKQ